MVSTECPTQQQLQEFQLGVLDEDTAGQVFEHAEHCTECQQQLDDLDSAEDDFLQDLKQSKDVGEPENPMEDSFASALERARKLPQQDSETMTIQIAVPTQLGAYRIEEKLGAGGMGTVYRAVHFRLNKSVALKVISYQVGQNPDVASRFEREMMAVGQLEHPHLVRAYDAGEHQTDQGRYLYLAMELIEGLDTGDLIARMKELRVADACEILRQTARGLESIHQHGLVHRDMKPSNVMISRQGQEDGQTRAVVKVLDLGLARFHQLQDDLTETGQVVGTLDYMSPEQAQNQTAIGPSSDLYSLGCMAFKLLTGRAPFADASTSHPLQKLQAHVVNAPPSLDDLRPGLPAELTSLVASLLAKSPADRPQSAAEVARALEPLCEGSDLATLLREAENRPTPGDPTFKETNSVKTQTTVDPLRLAVDKRVHSSEQKTQPEASGTRSWKKAILAGLGALAGLFLLAQIIIFVQKPGEVPKKVVLPEESGAEVSPDGKVTVIPGPKRRQQLEPGEPISPTAIVNHPAKIKGLESWTIDTVTPRGPVAFADFSSNGKYLATLGWVDKTIRVWDVATGNFQRAFLPSYEHSAQNEVRPIAFSPDGKTLAHANFSINLWDVETGETQAVLKHPSGGEATAIAFSADGKLLASAHKNVRIWDLASQRQIDFFPLETESTLAVLPSFSPDGTTLAVFYPDQLRTSGWLSVWDLKTGQRITRQKFAVAYHVSYLPKFAWAPEGNRLAFSGGNDVQMWDTKSWKQLPVTIARKGYASLGLAWSKDGKQISLGTDWFNAQTGDLVESRPYEDETYRFVLARERDGLEFVIDSMEYTQEKSIIRNRQTGKTVRLPDSNVQWSWINNSPGFPKDFAWRSPKEYIWGNKVWSMSGEMLRPLSIEDRRSFEELSATSLRCIASPDGTRYYEANKDRLVLKSFATDAQDVTLEGVKELTPYVSKPLVWSRDGKMVVVCDVDRHVRIFDAKTGKEISHPTSGCEAMQFSPDGKTLATAGAHHGVYVWDVKTGKQIRKLTPYGGIGHLKVLGWSDDGQFLTVRDLSRGGGMWNVKTGELVEGIPAPNGYGKVSPDGRIAAFHVGANVRRFWQFEGNKDLGALLVMPRQQHALISPEGHYAGSPRAERDLIYIAQTKTGQQTYTPEEFQKKFGWKNDPRFTKPLP